MGLQRTDIYQFSDYREYLKAVGPTHLSGRGRRFTLNKWAEKLGYRSQRSVGMVLSGFRVPSTRMVHRISQVFEHDSREHRYFELLVEIERLKKRGQSVEDLEARLEDLRPRSRTWKGMEEKAFAYVADWFHLVIRQMTRCKGFLPNPTAISRKLGGKVSPQQVRDAIRRMVDLGLLERCEGPRQFRPSKGHLFAQTRLPSEARRLHHVQMIQRAREAVDDVPMEARDMSCITLPFPRHRMEEAREMIARFRDEFDARFDTEGAGDIYQLNIQFFPHTEGNEDES